MDGLEAESRPLMEAARKRVAAEKGGEDALKPWNLNHALAGDIEKVRRAFAEGWLCDGEKEGLDILCLVPSAQRLL